MEDGLARVPDMLDAPAGGRRQTPAQVARKKVYLAVKSGRLTRGECERSGPDCRGRIEGHHDDYDRPLDVRWLCRHHHDEVHRQATGDGYTDAPNRS